MTIRLLIAEDHSVVRQGLRMVLDLDDELEVVGEASNGAEALALARDVHPDVVLMDVLMPVMDGIAATAAIRQELPDTEVLALTSVLDDAAVAGAVAVQVLISPWLLICVTLLAVFVSLAKRRHELTLLAGDAVGHRPSLAAYSPYLLDQMISVVTAATLISYIVYTTNSDTASRVGSGALALTIPFVLYGLLRYLYLVHREEKGGSPTTMLKQSISAIGMVTICQA